MQRVTVREVRMVCGREMILILVVLRRLSMVLSRLFVVLCGHLMMLRSLVFRHARLRHASRASSRIPNGPLSRHRCRAIHIQSERGRAPVSIASRTELGGLKKGFQKSASVGGPWGNASSAGDD
jgi:hypothetical protein